MTSFNFQSVGLSIIVPVLNEREELPGFLTDLARQQEVGFELIICDGGSTDGSCEWLAQQSLTKTTFKLLHCPTGRGRQLNCGIAAAQGEWLLFLHVDSRFSDPLVLKKALIHVTRSGSVKVAGHFALVFRRSDDIPSLGYYFYEAKARLGLPETIHGDQGFMIHRQLVTQVGAFAETLPAMEDTDFADRLRHIGQWQLLPAEISTSARRFETEGLWQRQLLGALIMCFRAIEWDAFFTAAPALYRQQSKARKLRVLPYFKLVRTLHKKLSPAKRWEHWYACGTYVHLHAWQLFFAFDVRRAFRLGFPPGQVQTFWLDFLLPVYNFLTDNLFGRGLSTVLLRVWFELTSLWLKIYEKD